MRISAHLTITAAVAATCLLCCSVAEAKKPGGGSAYVTIDLLGFDNGSLGYQSAAWFISERNTDDAVAILGNSFERYPGFPGGSTTREEFPAYWYVDANGMFGDPLNLGHTPSGNLNLSGANNLGDFVGDAYVYVPGLSYQPLPPVDSTALDINDLGQIVGRYWVDPNEYDGRATVGGLWQLDAYGTISGPEYLGFFDPQVISNCGVMAGHVGSNLAIGWMESGELQLQISDSTGGVAAINDHPVGDPRLTVVGTDSNIGYAWRPFDNAIPFTVLGTLGGGYSKAFDVNNNGQIVGYSNTKRHGHQAFLYSNGAMVNLNTQVERSSNTLQWATGINDDGDIIGFMRIPKPVSEQRAFLLRPNASN